MLLSLAVGILATSLATALTSPLPLTLALGTGTGGDAPRPNIVLILCDDMGWSDVGSYGGEIDTPHLDRLAAQGLRFRSFSNNAKCEHTRASLLTGRWWHHVGASASVTYRAPTFGERMRDAGYRTMMSGKWHAGQTPFQRGFDRAWGLTDGCCNYWNPGHARPGEPEPAKKRVRRWADGQQESLPFTPDDPDFYTTDAFTDRALAFLREAEQDDDTPFLLYLAYTAPHYPLHAAEDEVEEYRARYLELGWDRLRERRFGRQHGLGILTANTALSPRDPRIPAWDSLDDEQRQRWALRMAAYAAMVDRMDRNIGRVLRALEAQGEAENTVLFFLSDNGACDDSLDRSSVPGSMPWEVTSYWTQGRPWANASNTPFRQYKTTDFEGGTRTPFIACWPGLIAPNTITDAVGHIVDLLPTMLELAGAPIPVELAGQSLLPALRGEAFQREGPLFWQFGRAAAVRDGRHKLVRLGEKNPWQLYDLEADPTELRDLAPGRPQQVRDLTAAWEEWWRSGREE